LEPQLDTSPTPAPSDDDSLVVDELRDAWSILSIDDRAEGFRLLARPDAEDFFFTLKAHDQQELILHLPSAERRSWMRLLAPDDAADLVQDAPPEEREPLLGLLDEQTRREVTALLAYAEDNAGGLMSPRFARVRPDMKVDEAISYLRKQAKERLETIYYVYVLDAHQHLDGVVSFRELLTAPVDRTVRDIMHTSIVTVHENMDQEKVSQVFAQHDLMSIPVIDNDGHMKGIVTFDDIVDVVQEEATEDIQKLGGMEALDEPYLKIDFFRMIKKRVGWLSALFISEMFTTTAMTHFEEEIERAVVLSLFVPLIMSSGGNSGSQATSLVIRAMALGEVKLRDWWRVIRRELLAGLTLGSLLGLIGLLRVIIWQNVGFYDYGAHYLLVAGTICCSVLGVVTWGTLTGSMLPFLLRALGLDPASASAPFVATLVDVTGITIYFTVAMAFLHGTLL
jgi:magnesium transporter